MESAETTYKGHTILEDNDDLYPYIIEEFIAPTPLQRGTCRYRTKPAAKAAITRKLTEPAAQPASPPKTAG